MFRDAAGLELGETHLKLAGTFFKHIVDNELIDHAVVALFHFACGEGIGFERTLAAVDGDELGFVFLVCGS